MTESQIVRTPWSPASCASESRRSRTRTLAAQSTTRTWDGSLGKRAVRITRAASFDTRRWDSLLLVQSARVCGPERV